MTVESGVTGKGVDIAGLGDSGPVVSGLNAC
jgi:hypothetical protein